MFLQDLSGITVHMAQLLLKMPLAFLLCIAMVTSEAAGLLNKAWNGVQWQNCGGGKFVGCSVCYFGFLPV